MTNEIEFLQDQIDGMQTIIKNIEKYLQENAKIINPHNFYQFENSILKNLRYVNSRVLKLENKMHSLQKNSEPDECGECGRIL